MAKKQDETKEELSQESTTEEVQKEKTASEKSVESTEENAENTEAKDSESTKPERKQIYEAPEIHINKIVNKITFGVLSPKFIKKMASAKIVTPELYDKEGYPVDGGLMDIRLGVIDPGLKCKTCGSKLKECIGHFGYIELARPSIHIKFVKYLLSLLRNTCKECGHVLIPQDKIDKSRQILDIVEKEEGMDSRRKAVKTIVQSLKTINKCPYCNTKQLKISLDKPSTFVEDDKRLSPIEVRARMERIPDADCELFGINPKVCRPEWMVMTVLPIPPVTIRPSITLESGERSEDDLTHKLGDIVRINQRLFENINAGAPEIIIEDLWDLLQYHITTFIDNNVAQLPPARHRSGQPLKTLTERIKSKEGRIRHNLAGKRTNFCARTVISPDPMLQINEVGVPQIIAMKLTIPETTRPWNIEYLKKFIKNGPKKYPGCNYIIRPDGKKKKITDETMETALEELQPGYLVERHLMDGDIAIFNRQPSLHRMSMMCHKVKVLPHRTLRLSPAVTAPYNADFDGDEMNLHIPQSEEARAEAEILMDVKTQLISPAYGLSIIGCIQDSLSGNYILSSDDTKMSREEAIELLLTTGVTDLSRLPNKKILTGKEIFSALLPAEFNFSGTSKSGEKVIIKDGMLIEGILDAKTLGGKGAGHMLRLLHQKYGADYTMDSLGKFFRLGIEVLFKYGFTAGLADSDLPEKANEEIEATLSEIEAEAQNLIEQFERKELEVFPGRSMKETVELKIMEVLNKARNTCGNIVKENVSSKTPTLIMMNSGAKGNILNLAQITALVGQMALRGGRINNGYTERTLSCFKKNDLAPAAKGFIKNCFKKGLAPHEFFFGAITGRDSLMDTALRTPKSGYLYRRLANAMQDLRVDYDRSVRDATGKIIQFKYGEDGIDVSRSENGIINVQRIIEEV